MAQNAVGRLFRCQNTSCTVRHPIVALTQKRCYSKNAIPTFPPTSSAELDKVLNRFREGLFIPFGLSLQQRKLMFREKYSQRLVEEPVTVTIGESDERFVLRHLNPLTRPKTSEITDVVSLMKTRKDWNNIVPFLAGLRMACRVIKPNRWEWLVRKAGEADVLGIVLECAKQSEQTGFRLNDIGVVRRLFFEIHRMAQKADFREPAVSKAISLAKQFVELMETPDHIEHNALRDPKRKPFVIGVLLELTAARALNERECNDESGEVLAYAERLAGSWKLGNYTSAVENWYQADTLLQENVPIYNGLKLTLGINGIDFNKPMLSFLNSSLNQTKQQIATLRQTAPENVKRKQKVTLGYQQSELLFRN